MTAGTYSQAHQRDSISDTCCQVQRSSCKRCSPFRWQSSGLSCVNHLSLALPPAPARAGMKSKPGSRGGKICAVRTAQKAGHTLPLLLSCYTRALSQDLVSQAVTDTKVWSVRQDSEERLVSERQPCPSAASQNLVEGKFIHLNPSTSSLHSKADKKGCHGTKDCWIITLKWN